MPEETASPVLAALLSPQGKILFEFFVVKCWDDRYLLDVALDQAPALAKRLGLYKLRANVTIEDDSNKWWLLVSFAPGTLELGHRSLMVRLGTDVDRAFGEMFKPSNETHLMDPSTGGLLPFPKMLKPMPVAANDYHAHRIALGIPEGGRDYDFGDAYPHEANFDLNNGVSFTKGCYVGQEIVARMQHKTVVRKRIVRVSANTELPPTRPEIRAGEAIIGKLGSVAGSTGLAMLRLDRVIEFQDKGVPITADGITLDVDGDVIKRQRKLMADRSGGV